MIMLFRRSLRNHAEQEFIGRYILPRVNPYRIGPFLILQPVLISRHPDCTSVFPAGQLQADVCRHLPGRIHHDRRIDCKYGLSLFILVNNDAVLCLGCFQAGYLNLIGELIPVGLFQQYDVLLDHVSKHGILDIHMFKYIAVPDCIIGYRAVLKGPCLRNDFHGFPVLFQGDAFPALHLFREIDLQVPCGVFIDRGGIKQ